MSTPFSFSFVPGPLGARRGQLKTPHGTIETPAFLFCATQASLKSLSTRQVKEAEAQGLLANTYHLMVQPGSDIIRRQGGLHRFMRWDGPLVTDSGGYQIFSLGHGSVSEEIKRTQQGSLKRKSLVKITEEGALFRSHTTGTPFFLTPERSIQIQHDLGADLILVLDECTPYHVARSYTEESLYLSQRWARRSLKEFQKTDDSHQAIYGIVQGGIYDDLRRHSVDFINDLDFFGHAIGGSLGATKEDMYRVLDITCPGLDPQRPVHLLGIGGIEDIFEGVARGIDTFDCVHPTRLARHGSALIQSHYWDTAQESFHKRNYIRLRKSCFSEDQDPIDKQCVCSTCQTYSRAYLHHLIKAGELLAISALTIHNIQMMNRLMKDIRQSIPRGELAYQKTRWIRE